MKRRFFLGPIVALLMFVAADGQPLFQDLFNGKDLTGWDGDPRFWSVEDGAITGRTTADNRAKQNTFIIWKDGKVRDFELHLKFKIVGGNSGVQYRSRDNGNHVVSGYQADLDGSEQDKYSGILYEEKGRSILAERGQKVHIASDGEKHVTGSLGDAAELAKVVKKGEWNDYVITAQGNHLVQKINGQTTVDVVDDESAKAAREGILALQIHTGPPMTVQFKEIQLKVLPEKP